MLVTLDEFRKDYLYDEAKNFLGKGTFGETYKAFSTLRKKDVAIKFYKGDLLKYDLGGEIRTAINLEHPNLIRYYNYFQIDCATHIEQVSIMEFANKGDMSVFLKGLPEPELLLLLTQDILKGLSFLEAHKVIHQDIKLENVLLKEDKDAGRLVAKIADFGLAKTTSADLFSKEKSSYHTMSGTPTYMAPEIIDKAYACKNVYGKPVLKYNTDLWAFGVMLFYLFFNDPPFGRLSEEKPLLQLMGDILSLEVEESKLKKIPLPYSAIIRQCLVKNANKRVSSANILLKLLDREKKRKKIVINPKKEPGRRKPKTVIKSRKKITIVPKRTK